LNLNLYLICFLAPMLCTYVNYILLHIISKHIKDCDDLGEGKDSATIHQLDILGDQLRIGALLADYGERGSESARDRSSGMLDHGPCAINSDQPRSLLHISFCDF